MPFSTSLAGAGMVTVTGAGGTSSGNVSTTLFPVFIVVAVGDLPLPGDADSDSEWGEMKSHSQDDTSKVLEQVVLKQITKTRVQF